ncbi:RagB/SusD family nutrient uptake outer membrane protein [Bacteroides sp.]|uniref:RagB/SusD family nutrient uptake outer membrane protein n=1 Tax=Bacteroides sp. TaxID=29523 RepID=UPI0023C779D8|nr:RagB/SusD family nutrient uptake outer membrane protein [Bacteroides sp.]MDE6216388.1 RagB/SusD family nutrient uptake outer membrane protein [Bacteroides sp.]
MKKYILLLVAAGLMSSCYDLDQHPHDKIHSGTFWKTETHAYQGMVAMYETLRNENVFGAYYNLDALGEIAMDINNWQMPTLIDGRYTARTGFIQSKWQSAYNGIFRANLLLQNIDGVDTSDEQKALYKAEAKFMRALYYFHLLDFYGGVPLYDETTIVDQEFMNMKKPRSTAEETKKFILDDLDEAVRVLPVKWESSQYGRATRGAAVALRGKVKLYTKDYSGAKDDFEEIVKDPEKRGYGYRLNDSYPDLFTLEADQSAEMIFSIQCVNGANNNYGLPYCLRLGTRAAFGGCWNNNMPTDILADMYEYKDGRPFSWDEIYPGFSADRALQKSIFQAQLSADKKSVAEYPVDKDKIRAIYESRDPRLEQTLITPYAHFLGCNGRTPKEMEYVLAVGVNEANGFLRDNLGHCNYYWRKFVPEGDMNGILEDRSYSPVDFPLIRYADVLLMLAECYNEASRQDDAIALINQVRQRPSTNMPALNSGAAWLEAHSKEEVFERIMHERAVELACEGHRFSDLRRWGLAEEKLNFEYDDILGTFRYKRIFKERDNLFPVPAVEFERNANLGNQNPGW